MIFRSSSLPFSFVASVCDFTCFLSFFLLLFWSFSFSSFRSSFFISCLICSFQFCCIFMFSLFRWCVSASCSSFPPPVSLIVFLIILSFYTLVVFFLFAVIPMSSLPPFPLTSFLFSSSRSGFLFGSPSRSVLLNVSILPTFSIDCDENHPHHQREVMQSTMDMKAMFSLFILFLLLLSFFSSHCFSPFSPFLPTLLLPLGT